MKAAQIVIVVLVLSALIGWVRQGHDTGHIARGLPFCGGDKPGIYDIGSLIMLGICLWGLSRLRRTRKSDDSREEMESVESEEASYDDSAQTTGDEDANTDQNSGSQNSP